MTAAALASRKPRTGMRPVRPHRDMGQIGKLIETAFAGQLDAAGLRMVREMRSLGRAGWLGWVLARFLLPPFANPHGYVWEEEGRLVGNASLLPVERFPERWVLANVAVDEAYRRKGIARSLVLAVLDLAREVKTRTVVLQVRSTQEGARRLYDSLGFRTLSTRRAWSRPPLQAKPEPPKGSPVRVRAPEEWHAQWTLANRIHPEGLVWPYPLIPGTFRPQRLSAALGLRSKQHWVWYETGQLLASLTARYLRQHRYWRLIMVVAPEARGRVEGPLLATALSRLPGQDAAVLDYAAGAAEDQISNLDFHHKDTFTWMGFDIA